MNGPTGPDESDAVTANAADLPGAVPAEVAIDWLGTYLRANDRAIRSRVRAWRSGHRQRIGRLDIVVPAVNWLSDADVEDVINTTAGVVCQHYLDGRYEPRLDPALFNTTLVLQAVKYFRRLKGQPSTGALETGTEVTEGSAGIVVADTGPDIHELALARDVERLRPHLMAALGRARTLTSARWSALQIVTEHRATDARSLAAIRTAAKEARTIVIDSLLPVLRSHFCDEVAFAVGPTRVRDVHDLLELLGLLDLDHAQLVEASR